MALSSRLSLFLMIFPALTAHAEQTYVNSANRLKAEGSRDGVTIYEKFGGSQGAPDWRMIGHICVAEQGFDIASRLNQTLSAFGKIKVALDKKALNDAGSLSHNGSSTGLDRALSATFRKAGTPPKYRPQHSSDEGGEIQWVWGYEGKSPEGGRWIQTAPEPTGDSLEYTVRKLRPGERVKPPAKSGKMGVKFES